MKALKIRFNIVIDDTETIELFATDRTELNAGNIGLTLAEAKMLLRNGQKCLIDAQASAYAERHTCEKCDSPLRHNGSNTIVMRTPFGKVDVDSPRFYRCICASPQSSKRSSTFSPLAELLPERTTPEFSYLQTKFSALMSYGLTLKVLTEILPIDESLDKPALRDNVARVAQRLDSELGDEPEILAVQELSEQERQSSSPSPVVVAIDGGYVRGCSKTGSDGCFEVIVAKSIPPEGDAKCFGFVQRVEEKPRRRLQDVLDAQGVRADQRIVFLSDGADTVRNLQRDMSPNAEHVLDWFHVAMRLTVMENSISGLGKRRMRKADSTLSDLLESVKWNIWHGKVDHALERAEELRDKLFTPFTATARVKVEKLRNKLEKFVGYIRANRAFIPNYGERYRAEKPISTSLAESAVDQIISRRFVKKQQMRWTDRGCHNVLQIRTRVINDELRPIFERWHPGMRQAA